ncbi:MAG: 6-pyruvoyl tetrahydropterin synthase [Ferrovum sp.]|nr:6-pyruvoyl tetrahydropterin synthase [Ferrovum sp.]
MWASHGFEAARQLRGSGDAARRHGHSFRVEGRRPVAPGELPSAVDLEAFFTRLQQTLRPLDYNDLNTVMGSVADDDLVCWMGERLELGVRLHLAAGPGQGVTREADGKIHGWLRDRFEAAHFLPHVPVGHKCGRLHGHGFEVVLHQPSGVSGMRLLREVWRGLRAQLHGRCLNELAGLDIPTSEGLAGWIWHQMQIRGSVLSAVTVYETATCGSTFDGLRYRIWKERSFDSAMRCLTHPDSAIHGIAGEILQPSTLWGHTYRLRLGLTAPLDALMGWAMDFGDVKRLFAPIYQQLDHHPLHERVPAGTTSALLEWIVTQTLPVLPMLDRVDLYETPQVGVIWSLPGGVSGPAA